MSGWFNSLGWWDQDEAYRVFDKYRENPTELNLNEAICTAIPIIRVVYSAKNLTIPHTGDEDDLISSAALTISKALPKIAKKPISQIGNDKQYMRYLFTCVVNAFYRELEILHGKSTKVQQNIEENNHTTLSKPRLQSVEAGLTLDRLPDLLIERAIEQIRFRDERQQICVYIIHQLVNGREVSKFILGDAYNSNKDFFIGYCAHLIRLAFKELRNDAIEQEDNEEESLFDIEETSLLEDDALEFSL